MIKNVSNREDSGHFDELLHINCVITVKLIMRRWKVKSERKILYLLDNREYTKIRNGDTISPLVVSTLYKYININIKGLFTVPQSYYTTAAVRSSPQWSLGIDLMVRFN